MISTGKRDRRIDVLMRQETRGASGDVRVEYVPRCRCWAFIAPRKGKETFDAGQDGEAWETRVTILYNSAVAATDQIVIAGVTHDIVLLNPLGRREGLELLVTRA